MLIETVKFVAGLSLFFIQTCSFGACDLSSVSTTKLKIELERSMPIARE